MASFYYSISLCALAGADAGGDARDDEDDTPEHQDSQPQLGPSAPVTGILGVGSGVGRTDDIAEPGALLGRVFVHDLGRGGPDGRRRPDSAGDADHDGDNHDDNRGHSRRRRRHTAQFRSHSGHEADASGDGAAHRQPQVVGRDPLTFWQNASVEVEPDVLSPSVRRVLESPRPSWRGRTHRWIIPVAVGAGIAIVAAADSGIPRFSAVLFAVGTIGLYLVSATVHYKVWDPRRLHLLFRLDHSMIMTFLAASTAPIGLAAIGGSTGWLLFGVMAGGVALGVMSVWLPFHPPPGFMNALFLMLGWWPVLFVVPMSRALGVGGMALLIGGGLIYTVGAFIVGSRRPDPNPHVFGYHEIWHLFVISANAVHYVLFWFVVTGDIPLG